MCVPRLRGKKTVPQTKKSWFANIFYVRVIDKRKKTCYNNKVVDDTAVNAGMAELADALDSGSSRGSSVKVQVLLPAPPKSLENTEFSRLFAFSFPLSHGGRGMHHLWRCVCRFSVRFYTLSGNITLNPMITWI